MHESIQSVREDIHAAGNLSETIPGVPPLGDAALKILEPWITDVVAAYGRTPGRASAYTLANFPVRPKSNVWFRI